MKIDLHFLKKIITENQGKTLTIEDIRYGYKTSEMEARVFNNILKNLDVLQEVFETDKELIENSVKYKKQSQRFQDINRIERKSFREYSRIENAVSSYVEELCKVFDNNKIKIETKNHVSKTLSKSVGILQISDTHFNELVELIDNIYDFKIASKRMQKFVDKSTNYFLSKGVDTVLLAMTGDLLNSDRRLDEIVSNATNRSKATFLAVQIIENMIIDLNKNFNVSIAGVCGNESRVGKDVGWQHQIASDNYDLTIYRILEYHMKGMEGITFIGGDELMKVVDIFGYNWLLIHGHQQGFSNNTSQSISKLVRLYSDKGINLRFIIFGHIHEAMIGDMYARSSSSVGSNSYSESGLMLTSRASQNIHIQYDNGEIDSIKIDLQDVENYCGYPIQKQLEAYNAKSASKLSQKETIFKIVI